MNTYRHILLILNYIDKKILIISIFSGVVISILDLFFYANITSLFGNSNITVNFLPYTFERLDLIYLLFSVLLLKSLLYINNLRFVRGYANDLEISLIKDFISYKKSEYLKFNYSDKQKELTEDLFYNIFVTKFINNVFTPIIKLFPEIFISLGIILFVVYSFPSYFFITLILGVFIVPLISFFSKKSSTVNKLIISNIFNYSQLIKHYSIFSGSYILNRDENFQRKSISYLHDNKRYYKNVISYNNIYRPLIELFLLGMVFFVVIFSSIDYKFQSFFIVLIRLSQQILTISSNFSSVNNNIDITLRMSERYVSNSSDNNHFIPSISKTDTYKLASLINAKSGMLVVNGNSGIGKSTMFKKGIATNILSFYSDIDFELLEFNSFVYIPQEPVIFDKIIDDLDVNDINFEDFKAYLISNSFQYFEKFINNNRLSGGQLILYNTLKFLYIFREKNVVFDEPTNGLDIKSKLLLRELILKKSKEYICIVISHDDFFSDFESISIYK